MKYNERKKVEHDKMKERKLLAHMFKIKMYGEN